MSAVYESIAVGHLACQRARPAGAPNRHPRSPCRMARWFPL